MALPNATEQVISDTMDSGLKKEKPMRKKQALYQISKVRSILYLDWVKEVYFRLRTCNLNPKNGLSCYRSFPDVCRSSYRRPLPSGLNFAKSIGYGLLGLLIESISGTSTLVDFQKFRNPSSDCKNIDSTFRFHKVGH